jgi:serine/threonine protein kinase
MSYEKLGEGGFGCVHKPSLTCSNKNISYKNKISKFMLSEDAVDELKEYALIHNIDKNKDFYLGVPERCKVKKTKKALRAIKKCNHMVKRYGTKTLNKSFKKFDLLIMDDGGIDIDYLSKKMMFLTPTQENKLKLKKILNEFIRLFNGIHTFQKHNIAHHDIKPQNIVYNMATNRINFIDFGHMRNMNVEKQRAIKSHSSIYSYPFWNYPLEIQFLNKYYYTLFSTMTLAEREKWMMSLEDDLRKNNDTKFVKAYTGFMSDFLFEKSENEKNEIQQKYLMAFYKFITEEIKKNNYNEILDKSIQTIDVYGLGLTLQYFMAHCKHLLDSSIIKTFEACFFNMITPDVYKRYTINKARDEYLHILTKYDLKL